MIKTAKDFTQGCEHDGSYVPINEVLRLMVDYAKLHVQEALKQASKKLEQTAGQWNSDFYNQQKRILNAYNIEENIK